MRVIYLYTDADLVAGCLKNKRLFQRRLYERYAAELLGVVMRYLPSKTEAEDVLQEGFIRIFKKLHTLKNPRYLKFWMKRVMINSALRQLENNKGVVFYQIESLELPDNTGGILSELAARDLLGIIGQLPDNARMVFNMFCIDGYSHSEIAQRLKIRTGTSKSQVHRARQILKSIILNEKQKANTDISGQAG